jgi:ribosomal protein L37AE/L43A
MRMVSKKHYCPDCGSVHVKRSRQRGVLERYLIPILQLRPYRCRDCYARFYAGRAANRNSHQAAA